MSLSEILIRRRMAVQLPTPTSPTTPISLPARMTLIRDMMNFGFIPSKELYERINTMEAASHIHDEVIPALKKLAGADVDYTPMYKNFPTEVMEKDDIELWLNAILHYWSYGELIPVSEDRRRPDLPEADREYKTVGVANERDVKDMFRTILNATVPYSPQDKDDIKELCKLYPIEQFLPKTMPHKENVATIASIVAEQESTARGMEVVKPFVKTATDVLRLIQTVYGDGDAALTGRVAVKKLSRPDRKAIVKMLEGCDNLAEDMKTRVGAWVRIGELVHPGEYKVGHPKMYEAFTAIRDKNLSKQVQTYNAKSEQAVTQGNEAWFDLAHSNPGMFARNLARMLRKDADTALKAWGIAAPKVSPALLWTVRSSLEQEGREYRTFIPKNAKCVIKIIPNTLTPIHPDAIKKATAITTAALVQTYAKKPPMGKVYIDPTARDCKIPNDTRTASMGRTLAKGSEVPFEDNKNTLRTFLWWTNLPNNERVDMDLSAILLDKDFNTVDVCSYIDLKGHTHTCVHSGDIVDGGDFDGKGAAEFIDINLERAKALGIKYVASTVHSFCRQPFTDTEHVYTGYMLRSDAERGAIFEPTTVKEKIKLTAPSTGATICAFDIENHKMIWVDAPHEMPRHKNGINNAIRTKNTALAVLYHTMHLPKPTVYDVMAANLAARGGELVDTPEEADVVVTLYNGDEYEGKRVVTPYDLDIFAGDLVPDKSVLPTTFWTGEDIEQEVQHPSDTVDMDEFGL